MSNTGYDYDTAAIRREARKIRQALNRVDAEALPSLQKVRSRLDGDFKGKAADALDRSLQSERSRIQALAEQLNGLYTALMRFADALEAADERVAQLMGR